MAKRKKVEAFTYLHVRERKYLPCMHEREREKGKREREVRQNYFLLHKKERGRGAKEMIEYGEGKRKNVR